MSKVFQYSTMLFHCYDRLVLLYVSGDHVLLLRLLVTAVKCLVHLVLNVCCFRLLSVDSPDESQEHQM